MAGGPTTPELVAAADAAGSFSALGLGTCSVDAAREAIAACAGTRFGVNIFHPQRALTETEFAAAQSLAAEEGAVLGDVSLNFGWQDKFEAALEGGAAVLWSMFGVFSEEEIARIHAAGAEVWTTVTTPAASMLCACRGLKRAGTAACGTRVRNRISAHLKNLSRRSTRSRTFHSLPRVVCAPQRMLPRPWPGRG